jgi:hypothetical protein
MKYRYNQGFKVLGIRGRQYFDPISGVLTFPTVPNPKLDGFYKSAFGPCCSNNGVVYGDCDANFAWGFTRMTKLREPEIIGYDALLRQNQDDFITTHATFLREMMITYENTFEKYTNNVDEALEHHADPHQKRLPRINAWKELMVEGKLYNDIWLTGPHGFMYKMKKGEVAKPGKVCRGIADLGVSASLQCFRAAFYLKKAMAEHIIEIRGGHIEFCPKPSSAKLIEVFKKLIDPPGRFYFVYFSDDSCLSIRTPTGVMRFNVDISSCDASHTPSLFQALIDITPRSAKETIRQAVDQCTQPITIRSRSDPKNKVTLQPNGPRLYSGSTITTVTNNLANILIALAIASQPITCKADVSAASASAGYVVTCQDCSEDWHQIQFLKHSPVIDTAGDLRALLNIGVLLRSSGVCKGDLPGKKTEPMKDRANRFQTLLLRGMYPRANFTLLKNMRIAVHRDNLIPLSAKEERKTQRMITDLLAYKISDENNEVTYSIPSSEVFKRYQLTDLQIAEIELDFGSCGFRDHYHSDGTSIILELDYGLTGRELE